MVTAPVGTTQQLGGRGRAVVLCPVERDSATGRLVPARSEATSATTRGWRPAQNRLDEAVGLARSIDLEIADSALLRVNQRRPATLLGEGAVAEWADRLATLQADICVVDAGLTPAQQRNLERAWHVKILDRTALILEIFGARARSRSGQLQVELAALTFQRSRLVRSWTHLERQRGGLGFIGGPGESQLEIDRRLIDQRIDQIKRALAEVRRTRHLQRDDRASRPEPVIALVGYTNAGKSSLFNRLTQAQRFCNDLLFATLDTKMRRFSLPGGRPAVLSDTVGFISDLPHQLVAAFHATLEEVHDADLILHVQDGAHPDWEAQRSDVETVLTELGIDVTHDPRLIDVANKVDSMSAERRDRVACSRADAAVSATTGEGLAELGALIADRLNQDRQKVRVVVPHSDGQAFAWLYAHGEVLHCRSDERFSYLVVRLSLADCARYNQRWGGLAAIESVAAD